MTSIVIMIVALEILGIGLYLAGYGWGLVLTGCVVAFVQILTLTLVWYTFKLIFQMNMELGKREKKATGDSMGKKSETSGEGSGS